MSQQLSSFLYLKASSMLHSKEMEKREASPDRQGKALLCRCGEYLLLTTTLNCSTHDSYFPNVPLKTAEMWMGVLGNYFLILTAFYCHFHLLGDWFFDWKHLENPLPTAGYWRHVCIPLLGYPYLLFQWNEDGPRSWSTFRQRGACPSKASI